MLWGLPQSSNYSILTKIQKCNSKGDGLDESCANNDHTKTYNYKNQPILHLFVCFWAVTHTSYPPSYKEVYAGCSRDVLQNHAPKYVSSQSWVLGIVLIKVDGMDYNAALLQHLGLKKKDTWGVTWLRHTKLRIKIIMPRKEFLVLCYPVCLCTTWLLYHLFVLHDHSKMTGYNHVGKCPTLEGW